MIAVNGVNLQVKRGQIHALIGPNGVGKITVFNLLSKFLIATSGTIFFDDKDIRVKILHGLHAVASFGRSKFQLPFQISQWWKTCALSCNSAQACPCMLSPEKALSQFNQIQRHKVQINNAQPIEGISSINALQVRVLKRLIIKKIDARRPDDPRVLAILKLAFNESTTDFSWCRTLVFRHLGSVADSVVDICSSQSRCVANTNSGASMQLSSTNQALNKGVWPTANGSSADH